jgi:hypothetical protein
MSQGVRSENLPGLGQGMLKKGLPARKRKALSSDVIAWKSFLNQW